MSFKKAYLSLVFSLAIAILSAGSFWTARSADPIITVVVANRHDDKQVSFEYIDPTIQESFLCLSAERWCLWSLPEPDSDKQILIVQAGATFTLEDIANIKAILTPADSQGNPPVSRMMFFSPTDTIDYQGFESSVPVLFPLKLFEIVRWGGETGARRYVYDYVNNLLVNFKEERTFHEKDLQKPIKVLPYPKTDAAGQVLASTYPENFVNKITSDLNQYFFKRDRYRMSSSRRAYDAVRERLHRGVYYFMTSEHQGVSYPQKYTDLAGAFTVDLLPADFDHLTILKTYRNPDKVFLVMHPQVRKYKFDDDFQVIIIKGPADGIEVTEQYDPHSYEFIHYNTDDEAFIYYQLTDGLQSLAYDNDNLYDSNIIMSEALPDQETSLFKINYENLQFIKQDPSFKGFFLSSIVYWFLGQLSLSYPESKLPLDFLRKRRLQIKTLEKILNLRLPNNFLNIYGSRDEVKLKARIWLSMSNMNLDASFMLDYTKSKNNYYYSYTDQPLEDLTTAASALSAHLKIHTHVYKFPIRVKSYRDINYNLIYFNFPRDRCGTSPAAIDCEKKRDFLLHSVTDHAVSLNFDLSSVVKLFAIFENTAAVTFDMATNSENKEFIFNPEITFKTVQPDLSFTFDMDNPEIIAASVAKTEAEIADLRAKSTGSEAATEEAVAGIIPAAELTRDDKIFFPFMLLGDGYYLFNDEDAAGNLIPFQHSRKTTNFIKHGAKTQIAFVVKTDADCLDHCEIADSEAQKKVYLGHNLNLENLRVYLILDADEDHRASYFVHNLHLKNTQFLMENKDDLLADKLFMESSDLILNSQSTVEFEKLFLGSQAEFQRAAETFSPQQNLLIEKLFPTAGSVNFLRVWKLANAVDTEVSYSSGDSQANLIIYSELVTISAELPLTGLGKTSHFVTEIPDSDDVETLTKIQIIAVIPEAVSTYPHLEIYGKITLPSRDYLATRPQLISAYDRAGELVITLGDPPGEIAETMTVLGDISLSLSAPGLAEIVAQRDVIWTGELQLNNVTQVTLTSPPGSKLVWKMRPEEGSKNADFSNNPTVIWTATNAEIIGDSRVLNYTDLTVSATSKIRLTPGLHTWGGASDPAGQLTINGQLTLESGVDFTVNSDLKLAFESRLIFQYDAATQSVGKIQVASIPEIIKAELSALEDWSEILRIKLMKAVDTSDFTDLSEDLILLEVIGSAAPSSESRQELKIIDSAGETLILERKKLEIKLTSTNEIASIIVKDIQDEIDLAARLKKERLEREAAAALVRLNAAKQKTSQAVSAAQTAADEASELAADASKLAHESTQLNTAVALKINGITDKLNQAMEKTSEAAQLADQADELAARADDLATQAELKKDAAVTMEEVNEANELIAAARQAANDAQELSDRSKAATIASEALSQEAETDQLVADQLAQDAEAARVAKAKADKLAADALLEKQRLDQIALDNQEKDRRAAADLLKNQHRLAQEKQQQDQIIEDARLKREQLIEAARLEKIAADEAAEIAREKKKITDQLAAEKRLKQELLISQSVTDPDEFNDLDLKNTENLDAVFASIQEADRQKVEALKKRQILIKNLTTIIDPNLSVEERLDHLDVSPAKKKVLRNPVMKKTLPPFIDQVMNNFKFKDGVYDEEGTKQLRSMKFSQSFGGSLMDLVASVLGDKFSNNLRINYKQRVKCQVEKECFYIHAEALFAYFYINSWDKYLGAKIDYFHIVNDFFGFGLNSYILRTSTLDDSYYLLFGADVNADLTLENWGLLRFTLGMSQSLKKSETKKTLGIFRTNVGSRFVSMFNVYQDKISTVDIGPSVVWDTSIKWDIMGLIIMHNMNLGALINYEYKLPGFEDSELNLKGGVLVGYTIAKTMTGYNYLLNVGTELDVKWRISNVELVSGFQLMIEDFLRVSLDSGFITFSVNFGVKYLF